MELKYEETELFNKLIKSIIIKLIDYKCIVKYDNKSSFGYLLKIPLKEGVDLFPVLITSLFPFKDSNQDKEIEVSFKVKQFFLFFESRTFYSSSYYDMIFFQIENDDDLYYQNFLELNISSFNINRGLFARNISITQDTFESEFSSQINNLENTNNIIENKQNQSNIGLFIKLFFDRLSRKLMGISIGDSFSIDNSNSNYKENSKEKKVNRTLNKSKNSLEYIFTEIFVKNQISGLAESKINNKSENFFDTSNDSLKSKSLLKRNNLNSNNPDENFELSESSSEKPIIMINNDKSNSSQENVSDEINNNIV